MGVCASAPKDHGSAVTVRIDFSAVRNSTPDLPRDDGDVFFDSRAWLDSDCEDFFSIYDESTPPRTPDCFPEIPSPGPKKLLMELLRESNDSDPVVIDRALQQRPTSPGPVDSPTVTHDEENNSVGRNLESSPCCLPNLVRNLSFKERKKRLSNGSYTTGK